MLLEKDLIRRTDCTSMTVRGTERWKEFRRYRARFSGFIPTVCSDTSRDFSGRLRYSRARPWTDTTERRRIDVIVRDAAVSDVSTPPAVRRTVYMLRVTRLNLTQHESTD